MNSSMPRCFPGWGGVSAIKVTRTLHCGARHASSNASNEIVSTGNVVLRTSTASQRSPSWPMDQALQNLSTSFFAEFPDLRGFIGPRQSACLRILLGGAEGDRFRDKLAEISERIRRMPAVHESGRSQMAHLRYQLNNYECLLVEKDIAFPDEDPADYQAQAYGFCRFHPHRGELGYVSLPEILAGGALLDLRFTPMPVDEVVVD